MGIGFRVEGLGYVHQTPKDTYCPTMLNPRGVTGFLLPRRSEFSSCDFQAVVVEQPPLPVSDILH